MKCTRIYENSEPKAYHWHDNYLCVSKEARIDFEWSIHTRIAGKKCVRWYVKEDPHAWFDNFLCL